MMPRLHDGDLVLIDITDTNIKSNKVYVIRERDDIRVKRLELRYDDALVIKSDNQSPEYSDQVVPKEYTDSIEVVGRVVHLVSGGGF